MSHFLFYLNKDCMIHVAYYPVDRKCFFYFIRSEVHQIVV
jgi:hypothetical protein